MNDHDRDLILGLATGSLSETEAAAAQARVDADPELAAELAEQRAAIEALATIEPVAMTADERSTLRESLVSQLHLDDAPSAAPAASTAAPRRASWWKPVFGLGAAAVFVTAIVVAPGMLGGSDDSGDTAADIVAADGGVTSTTPAQAFEESTGGADGTADTSSADIPEPDGSELLAQISLRSAPDDLASVDIDGVTKNEAPDRRFDTCSGELDEGYPNAESITPLGVSNSNDRFGYAAIDQGGDSTLVVTVDLDSCTIVDVDE